MFDLQSKVATQVATTLNLTLLPPEKAALGAKPTRSRAAYGFYQRARQILDSAQQPAEIREAISPLGKATDADSRFVAAWAYTAIAHTELYALTGDPSKERLRLARVALDKATTLDSDVPEAQVARGIYLYKGERNYEG